MAKRPIPPPPPKGVDIPRRYVLEALGVLRGLTNHSTHWEGCEKQHYLCAAIRHLEYALEKW